MFRSASLALCFLSITCGFLSWSAFQAKADPPPPACSNGCADRELFIATKAEGGLPTQGCHSFNPLDCAWCVQGQCVDGPVVVDASKCEKQTGKTVTISTFIPGSCTQKCAIGANTYSEASLAAVKTAGKAWTATQHHCPPPIAMKQPGQE